MKGFALDSNGDLLIEGNRISMISGEDLIRQTVQTVLGTNKGEWSLNIDEGIDFSNILGKKKSDDIIKNEILQGLLQIDESFVLDSFSCEIDKINRKLVISFTARNGDGETVAATVDY